MNISQLARSAGVSVDTVRFYEKQRLLPEPPRSASGYRIYSQSDVSRLAFIRNAKAVGFTLDEIAELLALRVSSQTSCDEVRNRAETKIADIKRKIAGLHHIRRALTTLAANCDSTGAECPLLEALAQSEHGT